MSKLKWTIIALNLGLLLVYFNCSVGQKETILKDGQLILLELAPVDPRSLMQGDYMRLSYAIANPSSSMKRGYCVVKLDSLGVGQRVRLQAKQKPLNEGEYLIEYTISDWSLNLGAESFFFEEGTGDLYAEAKYGGIRVDKHGNSVLVGLFDENREFIRPNDMNLK